MMKKVIFFLVLLFVGLQAYGQWSVKAGSTFTKFTADGSTMGVGTYAGASYDINILAKNLYFRPGLVYHYDKATAEIPAGSHKMTFNMHYLKLPLNFSYHIKLHDDHYLNPYVGGYIYCGLFGSFKDKYDWGVTTNTTTYKQLERFNYGLTGGLEYELKQHFLFNVEYNIGLNGVRSFDLTGSMPDFLKKLNTLNIGLGYKF